MRKPSKTEGRRLEEPRTPVPRGRLAAMIRENRKLDLSPYLRRLAHAAVASAWMATGACGSDVHEGTLPIEVGAFEPPLCEGERWLSVQDITPTSEVDFVGARNHLIGLFSGIATGPGTPEWIDWSGTPCLTAADRPTCETAVEDVPLGEFRIVTTVGDEVTVWGQPRPLTEFLGTIDTAQEALLVVRHEGYDVRCGNVAHSSVREVEGGFEVLALRRTERDGREYEIHRHHLFVGRDGSIVELGRERLEGGPLAVPGRRPPGILCDASDAARTHDAVGAYLARAAFFEDGAVHAFRILATELEAWNAPFDLVRDAWAAASDEVRHAEAMTHLAQRFGAHPPTAVVEPRPLRSLFEIALDNATEGCVNETFSALVGVVQASTAADPEVAAIFREIADDELRHAALSWKIASWIEPRLSEEERRTVAAARDEAVNHLRRSADESPDPTLAHLVGLPTIDVARSLVDHLEVELIG